MTPDIILRGIYHIDRNSALQTNYLTVLMLTLSCIVWIYLSDKIGSHITMLLAYSGLIISANYFYYMLSSTISLLALTSYYGIMELFVGAIVLTPIVNTRAFPPAIRYSDMSFTYNIAYAIFVALTPIISAWLQQSHMAPTYYVSAVAILAIIVGFLPLT